MKKGGNTLHVLPKETSKTLEQWTTEAEVKEAQLAAARRHTVAEHDKKLARDAKHARQQYNLYINSQISDQGIQAEESWQMSANCKDQSNAQNNHYPFYPIDDNEKKSKFRRKEAIRVREAMAKSICEQCVVQVECLKYALENHIEHGIWGGATEDERMGLAG